MADQVVGATISIIQFIIQWKRDYDDANNALSTIVTTVELVKNSLIALDTKKYVNLGTPLRALMDCLNETKDILIANSKKKGKLARIFFPGSVTSQIEVVENRILKLVNIMNLSVAATHLAQQDAPALADTTHTALDFIVSSETKKFWQLSFGEAVYSVRVDDLEKALMAQYNEFLDAEALCDLRLRLDNLKTGFISCHRLSDFCGEESLSKCLRNYTKKMKTDELPSSPLPADFSLPLLLWVDDKPGNNLIEIEYAKQKGVFIVMLTSTSEAKQWITRHPDILDIEDSKKFRVITDNARDGVAAALDLNAGEDMIRFVRGRRSNAPILVYCGNLEYTKYTQNYKECGATIKRADCHKFIEEMAI